jgi:hypothetical protein
MRVCRRLKDVGRLTGEGSQLVPYEAEQEAVHGNVLLRAQEKALRLIAEAVAAKGRALLHIGEGAHVELQGVQIRHFRRSLSAGNRG